MEAFGVTEPDVIEFLNPRLVDMPINAFLQASKALLKTPENISQTYVRCTGFQNPTLDEFLNKAENDPDVNTQIVDMSHFVMMTNPQETAELLLNAK